MVVVLHLIMYKIVITIILNVVVLSEEVRTCYSGVFLINNGSEIIRLTA